MIPGVGAGFELGDYDINSYVWLSRLGALYYFAYFLADQPILPAVRDAAAGAGVDLDAGAVRMPPPLPPAPPPRLKRRVEADAAQSFSRSRRSWASPPRPSAGLRRHHARRRRRTCTGASKGPFGRFDQEQLQRGYKVYHDVCSSCHAMHLM